MRKLGLTVLLSVTALSGCTMIPGYDRPDFAASATWEDVPGYETTQGEAAAKMLAWEEFFQSPELKGVIQAALDHNKDLRVAALNIEAARAAYRIQRADLVPSLNANGNATIQGTSEDTSPTLQRENTKIYNANLGVAAYEVDLFGRVRSENTAALNEYLATDEARNVVQIALIAETANAYLQLLADQKLLKLTQQTLSAQQQTYDILAQSMNTGIATDLDVARAATAVETAQVNLHQYRRNVAQDRNALVLLIGKSAGEIKIPEMQLDEIKLAESLKVGLPAEVLLSRPDIRQAEYELLARNADIGAARAAFFPQINLTGTYGFASTAMSGLFSGGAAGAWSFVPQITVPIFQGGRNVAALDLAKVRQEQAVVNYERAIQTAFREVSDELAARSTLSEQLRAQRRLVAAALTVYDLSNMRYRAGIDSFLSVLDSQRELYTAQQNQILIENQRLANLVNLYKALGGGLVRP